jgi:DNA polymerase (family X)
VTVMIAVPSVNLLNQTIAAKLREMADLLQQQGADRYRVTAYRRAAEVSATLPSSLETIAREKGLIGLVALPAIGRSIAAAIMEMLATGRWAQLERLKGELEPEQLFRLVPGIGPELAKRIHETLDIDTLESLELAAYDGRLAKVPNIGPRRAAAILAALTHRLGRRRIKRKAPSSQPPVGLILDVDREYREKSAASELTLIAPKRFNPDGKAWLPVLHAKRGAWHFTALFSNTKQAHDLGKTGDWVVIYVHTDDTPETQCTVVTETHGPLTGQRVVRGREGDCIAHYAGAA